jgi:hypothetical protein
MVSIRLYPERVILVSAEGEIVAHDRLLDRGVCQHSCRISLCGF